MPTCPNCDVAYLDGESHHCGRAGDPRSVHWITLGGALSGALAGTVLVTILCMLAGQPWFVIPGVVIGAPIGAAVGAVLGARRANRK